MNLANKLSYFSERAHRYLRTVGGKKAAKELVKRFVQKTADIRSAQKAMSNFDSGLCATDLEFMKSVSRKIHFADAMYVTGNAHQYFSVGLSAIHCIEKAVQSACIGFPIDNILDLPCGYGRVLRFLACKYPKASITACDIDANAVQFCAKTFQAIPMLSRTNFHNLHLEKTFNLIWCGSLVTHIDELSTLALLDFFKRHLAGNGLAIFTALGHLTIEKMRNNTIDLGLSPAGHKQVMEEFLEKGYGYAAYPNNPGLGIAAVQPAYMRKLAKSTGLKEVFFMEHGWEGFHDVYGYMLAP